MCKLFFMMLSESEILVFYSEIREKSVEYCHPISMPFAFDNLFVSRDLVLLAVFFLIVFFFAALSRDL